MIDGHLKKYQDVFWNKVAVVFVKLGFSANGVTILGVILSLVNAGCYIYHRNHLMYGIFIALIEFLDDVDGAVARITDTCSKFGAYLDAATDRYKESIMFFAIAYVTGYWILCFIGITGSLITSYNKARAGMEIPINNEKWPDVFERLERIITVCAGLIFGGMFSPTFFWGHDFLFVCLFILCIMTYLSGIQRLFRAYSLFKKAGEV